MTKKTASPTPDQMRSAAQWLQAYEGSNGDEENKIACELVADWLEQQASEKELKSICKQEGIPFTKVKKALSLR